MGKSPNCSSEKSGLKKGPWTVEEDEKLTDYIKKHGHGRWRTLPMNAGLKRCGKSCRLRWTNYLRPDIKRGGFSLEEEDIIIQLHGVLGNKWSTIASHLPGRTDNEIKNYWNTCIRKKMLKMGIDPVTHTPCLDLLELSSLLTSALYNSSSHQLNINIPNQLGNNINLNPVDHHFVNSQEFQDHDSQIFKHSQVIQNPSIFQTFLQNQLQNYSNSDVQTTSLSTGQLSQSLTNLLRSCPNSYTWQNNNREASITTNDRSFVPLQQNYSYKDLASQSNIINNSYSSENQGIIYNGIIYNNNNIQNMSYGSHSSTTPNSYISTPLNSSPTNYVNCSSAITEEERGLFLQQYLDV